LPSVVRRCLNFRHTLVEIAWRCPKIPQLRTHLSRSYLELSEVTKTSDTPQQKLSSVVRRYLNFGHICAAYALCCPKMSKIQTHPCGNCLALSEDTSTSDTAQQKLPSAVRRYLNFRRTSAEVTLSCPKLPKLRTHLSRNCLALSEDASTSDTAQQKLLCAVRSYLNFGHPPAEIAKRSPKIHKLRTHLRRNCLAQSEVTKTSATAQQKLPSAVRRYLNFRHTSADIAFPCPKNPNIDHTPTEMAFHCQQYFITW